MKIRFLVNTRSGVRRKIDHVALLREVCRASVPEAEIESCREKEDLDRIIAEAEASGVDVLCAVGGDGTVHELAKRLVGRRVALGIIPTGSGNGFARHLGIPLDCARAVQAVRDGRIETIDAGEVNGEVFAGVFGIGFDALVAHRFALNHARGLKTYVREGAKAYFSFRPETYTLTTGATTRNVTAFTLTVANSNQYGNNARVAPRASLHDGLLDVVIVEQPSIAAAPVMLARLFSGSFDRSTGVTTMQVERLTIERQHEGPAHFDGEPVLLGRTLEVRVLPRALRVVVPKDVEHLQF